jgi:hypothetical protein
VQYLAMGSRALLEAVFLISLVGKVAGRGAFSAFTSSVRGMRVLPPGLAAPVATLVLAAESTVCVLLAVPVPPTAVVGFGVAAGLLVTFAVAIVLAVNRGVRAPCRCFGASTIPIGLRHAARNIVLAVIAALGLLASLASGSAHVGGLAVAACAGLALGGLVTAFDTVLELFQPLHRATENVRSAR